MMKDDSTLLRQYADEKSAEAFGELVRRHLDFVHSAALREVRGDFARAQDITQNVFIALARKASVLHRRTTLVGWLHVSVHHAAAELMRTEQRRQRREKEASVMLEPASSPIAEDDWSRLKPVLNEVVGELGDAERDAILLRFYQKHSLVEIGAMLHVSEDAAQKRVTRGLEKMRAGLVRRGISSTSATIFLLHEDKIDADGTWRVAWQAGFQHESNGKGGGAAPVPPQGGLVSTAGAARHPSDSRSFNSLYVAPKVHWTRADGLFTEAGFRASAYFQTDDNDDIARYRGYLEANFRAGFDRGLQVAVQARGHPQGHGSFECNASWPANRTPLLRFVLPETMGGYAQIQYFNGYGESLLDYDVRRKDQLRFGLMLVR
jgi:RNA polymerase sigma factor (sigma-70 family)